MPKPLNIALLLFHTLFVFTQKCHLQKSRDTSSYFAKILHFYYYTTLLSIILLFFQKGYNKKRQETYQISISCLKSLYYFAVSSVLSAVFSSVAAFSVNLLFSTTNFFTFSLNNSIRIVSSGTSFNKSSSELY